MTNEMIGYGDKVKVKVTGENGLVASRQPEGSYRLFHAGDNRMNIAVFHVLLDSGEVRQYVYDALELA